MADEPPFVLTAEFARRATQVTVTGDLDIATVSRLAEMLTVALARKPGRLIVDLSGVRFMDCASARVIAEAAQALPSHRLTLRHPAPIVRRLLELTGLATLIEAGQGPPPRTNAAASTAVTVAIDGRICVLTVTGNLDLPAIEGFAAQTAQAVAALDGPPERLVLDLGGLIFLDCAGARALAQVAASVPPGCPVIVRAVSQAAARILELTGLNLERPPAPGAIVQAEPDAIADHDEQLMRQVRLTHARMTDLVSSLRTTAERLAITGDKVAATFARMAESCPQDADRLSALSAAAHEYAARNRRHAVGPPG